MSSIIDPITFQHRYPFPVVCKAFFSKFPHKSQPNVLKSIVIEERQELDHLYRKREILINNKAPWIIKYILGSDTLKMEDETWYYEKDNYMIIKGVNISYSSIVEAREESKFYQSKENPHWTVFHQEGFIKTGTALGPFQQMLADFVAPRMRQEGITACELLDEQLYEKFPDQFS